MNTVQHNALLNAKSRRPQRRSFARARHHYALAMNAQPPGWQVVELYVQGLEWKVGTDMTVTATVTVIRDKHWLHVSAARADRVPNHEELTDIKHRLFGPKIQAFMVFPEQKNHLNIHKFCLHLFGSSKGDGPPDFSTDGMI